MVAHFARAYVAKKPTTNRCCCVCFCTHLHNKKERMVDWSQLKGLAPEYMPVPWMVINGLCCVWSIWLFWVATAGLENTSVGNFAKETALGYNFVITAIWCTQVVLQEWVKGWFFQSKDFLLHGEALLAIYFLFYSAYSCYEWNFRGQSIKIVALEVLFNTCFYLFMIGRNVRKLMQRRQYTSVQQEAEEVLTT